jgi:FkbM family methyltransferase
LAPVRGFRRLPEYFQQRFASDDTFFIIKDFDGDLQFRSQFSSHIGSHIYWKGRYAASVLALLGRLLIDPEMVMFDVGANEGEETVFAAKRLTSGLVYGFEPNADVYKILAENIRLNGFHNVRLVQLGMDRQAGNLPLYGPAVRDSDGTINNGLATIFPREGIDRAIGTIKLTTLDDFVAEERVARLDILKIDVEGAELNVLQGGNRVLSEYRPVVILEVWQHDVRSADVLRYVMSKGYSIHNISEDGLTVPISDLAHTTRDTLCVPLK